MKKYIFQKNVNYQKFVEEALKENRKVQNKINENCGCNKLNDPTVDVMIKVVEQFNTEASDTQESQGMFTFRMKMQENRL